MTSLKTSAQPALPHNQSLLKSLFGLPTRTECQACWELCRLHNNIGFWVVWLPTAWSVTMAYCAYGPKNMSALDVVRLVGTYVPLCFGIKSLIMAIDDILDADVDGLVQRTKMRPLPRGAITTERAWLFFFLQVVTGVYLACEFLPPPVRRISMWAWPLYVIYPTCKRWTNLAPIPLGLMFNIGIFMGWVHAKGSDDATPWSMLCLVYLAACLWTFTYETVYQHQDKKDDTLIGLHSPALLLGSYTKPICTVTGLGFFALFAYAGWLNGQGISFFAGLLCAAAMLFAKLIATNIDVPNDCREFFLKTVPIGQVILIGLVVDAGVLTWVKTQ